MSIINRIREMSKQKGISLSFLCKQMNVNRVYFIDCEKTGRTIPDDKLSIIATTLNTSVEFLKGETEQKENPLAQFSPEMVALVERIRKLSPDMAKKALEYIDFIAQKK